MGIWGKNAWPEPKTVPFGKQKYLSAGFQENINPREVPSQHGSMAQQHSMYLEWGWLLAKSNQKEGGINEERKEKEYSHTAKQGKQDHFI